MRFVQTPACYCCGPEFSNSERPFLERRCPLNPNSFTQAPKQPTGPTAVEIAAAKEREKAALQQQERDRRAAARKALGQGAGAGQGGAAGQGAGAAQGARAGQGAVPGQAGAGQGSGARQGAGPLASKLQVEECIIDSD